MADVSCCVCGVLVQHPLPRCGLVLCPDHHKAVAWSVLLPAEFRQNLIQNGFTDHHTDADLTRALAEYARQCEFCGGPWYHCQLQPTRCCSECTHPKENES